MTEAAFVNVTASASIEGWTTTTTKTTNNNNNSNNNSNNNRKTALTKDGPDMLFWTDTG